MQQHIRRDDGKWLVGPGATQVADEPSVPFQSLSAAMAAINRYRLSSAFHCPERQQDQFTLFAAK